MELALAIFILFTLALVVAIITIPLMVISRLFRVWKNSFAKLFNSRAKKA